MSAQGICPYLTWAEPRRSEENGSSVRK